MRFRSRRKIEWAAGLFEGEGSVLISKTQRPRLQMQMADLDVLEKLQDILGGSLKGPYGRSPSDKNTPRKPCWRWYTTGDSAAVAKKLLPHLGIRRSTRIREVFEL